MRSVILIVKNPLLCTVLSFAVCHRRLLFFKIEVRLRPCRPYRVRHRCLQFLGTITDIHVDHKIDQPGSINLDVSGSCTIVGNWDGEFLWTVNSSEHFQRINFVDIFCSGEFFYLGEFSWTFLWWILVDTFQHWWSANSVQRLHNLYDFTVH